MVEVEHPPGVFINPQGVEMRKRRFDMHRLQELVRLHRMGVSVHEVARTLRMGPNTERAYRRVLEQAGLLDGAIEDLPALETLRAAVNEKAVIHGRLPQEQSSVEGWRERVRELMAKGLRARAIYDRLRLDDELPADKYWSIKRLCRALCKETGIRADEIAIPVENAPGEIAQVDFGYVGRLVDPQTQTLRRAWVFVMVLGHSRHMVAFLVFNQRTETWLDLHVRAFAELGGVVKTVVPDNLKAAVVRAAFAVDGESELNRSYRELARHYGFQVDPAPPRQAKKKGKVEAAVKYVKRNGLAGLEGTSIDVARSHLARWLREIAGQRVHGTTGWKPAEVFQNVEAVALRELPAVPFSPVIWKRATVHPDIHIEFERRLYSVPWRLKGAEVWVKALTGTVAIYANDELVTTHDRKGPSFRSTKDEHLPEGRRDLRHRSRGYWERRAAAIGSEVEAYVTEVFDSDDVLSQLRAVQAIVQHLETFPRHRAIAACARARLFGNYRYLDLKNILRRGLDMEALPATDRPEGLQAPRFARSIQEILPFEEVI